MLSETLALAKAPPGIPPAVVGAVSAWADATTDATSDRRRDLLRDKRHAVLEFLAFARGPMVGVRPADVKRWQADLEGRGLAAASIYARVSRVSSFFRWAMRDASLAEEIRRNPADLARPKAPKPYQSESTQALDDDEIRRLLRVVREKAEAGNITAKRDYALLLLFFLTGLRRSEVIRLRWRDIEVNSSVVLLRTLKLKGGDYRSREVRYPAVRDALVDYLRESGRLEGMKAQSPLWTRHDRAGKPGRPITSHAFALNLKRYAKEAGVASMHCHRTRHSFARMISEDTGSIIEVQDALGHRSASVTRVYVQRIAVKRDRRSEALAKRLGV
jgi:integrase/recombinase XerC